jgi:hypothetical protein
MYSRTTDVFFGIVEKTEKRRTSGSKPTSIPADQSMGLSQPVDRAYGLGMAKTAQLKAALEIGRRLGLSQLDEKYQIKSPADAANLMMMEMAFLDHEHSDTHVPVAISTLQSR